MKKAFLAAAFWTAACLYLIFCGARASHADGPGQGCVTAQCHQGMLKTKDIHPGVDPCESCHQSVATPHPQKNRKTFKLTQEVPALCFQCHQAFGTMKHIHPPVKDGMCTTCHNPHDSDQPKLLTQPLKDLCSQCHPDKIDYKNVHPAVDMGCTVCHSPHESNNDHLLQQQVPSLCFTCHSDMETLLKKKYVHPAVEMGCTACHNPHGSPFKKFLSAEGPALCFQCHPDIQEKLKTTSSVHPPIKTERGCLSCHNPHANDAPKLLPKEGKDLCLGCHKDLIKKNQTVLHGPIRDGMCTACHDPHGTPNIKLLIQPFSESFYVSYKDTDFPLCFSCHDRDLVSLSTTTSATGFRDGDRNLHYVHVHRKEQGKACIVCHNVHASQNPRLINTTTLFGKWNLPLNFVKTETGGSCLPGCHRKYSYDRKNPVRKATPE